MPSEGRDSDLRRVLYGMVEEMRAEQGEQGEQGQQGQQGQQEGG